MNLRYAQKDHSEIDLTYGQIQECEIIQQDPFLSGILTIFKNKLDEHSKLLAKELQVERKVPITGVDSVCLPSYEWKPVETVECKKECEHVYGYDNKGGTYTLPMFETDEGVRCDYCHKCGEKLGNEPTR